MCQFSSP